METSAELRDAVVAYLRSALDAYDEAAKLDIEAVAAGFRNDDSRLRSAHGWNLME